MSLPQVYNPPTPVPSLPELGKLTPPVTAPVPKPSVTLVVPGFYEAREPKAPPSVLHDLQAMRLQLQKRGYTVGLTSRFGKHMSKIGGGVVPADIRQQVAALAPRTQQMLEAERLQVQDFIKNRTPIFIPPALLPAGLTADTAASLKAMMDAMAKQLAAQQAGAKTPSAPAPPSENVDLLKAQLGAQQAAQKASAHAPSRFDLRSIFGATHVKNQGYEGTCWDFAGCAALESSELMRNNIYADISEQQVCTCSNSGTVGGGNYGGVMAFFAGHGASNGDGAECPYLGIQGSAGQKTAWNGLPSWYHASAYGYVGTVAIPSVNEIKAAIVAHGALATYFTVPGNGTFDAYTGGVYDDTTTNGQGSNHCMAILGWDDAKGAWIVKNSWGTGWGETCDYGKDRGYAYIAYNSDNIGLYPMWVDAALTDQEGIWG